MGTCVLAAGLEEVDRAMIGETERELVGDDCPPEERQQILSAFATMLDADAIHARQDGQFDRANAYAEVCHQLRSGHVVETGEFKMLEDLK